MTEPIQNRAFWTKKAENAGNDEEIDGFLRELQNAPTEQFLVALPTMCLVSSKTSSERLFQQFESISAKVLLAKTSTRADRRAVLACLKEFRRHGAWNDFYNQVEALEEPQYHIVQPILERFDALLGAVRDGRLAFVWPEIVLNRAMAHSNGWIRAWAVEKSVRIDEKITAENPKFPRTVPSKLSFRPTLANVFQFVTSFLLPHLNNNDVFWRLLELATLPTFLESLRSTLVAPRSSPRFLESLLDSIAALTCPTAMFFVVSELRPVRFGDEFLSKNEISSFRSAVSIAQKISHKSIRLVTVRNLTRFLVASRPADEEMLAELAKLIGYLRAEATEPMLEHLFTSIQPLLSDASGDSDEHAFHRKFHRDEHIREHARLFWLRMHTEPEKQEEVKKRIELTVKEMLLREPGSEELPSLLYLLNEKNEESALSSFDAFITRRLASTTGSRFEAQLLRELFTPLFLRNASSKSAETADRLLSGLAEHTYDCEALVQILEFLDAIFDTIPAEKVQNLRENWLKFAKKVENLERKPEKKVAEFSVQEFNQIISKCKSLILKFENVFRTDSEDAEDVERLLSDSIDNLSMAASFAEKEQLCLRIAAKIRVSRPETAFSAIRAVENVVKEEKKSLNSLPALQVFIEVALRGARAELAEQIVPLVERHMEIANQSTPVALILVDGLTQLREQLDEHWAPFLTRLALFGPVPKKESRVISHAYWKMFDEEPSLLEHDPIERLDEVVQKARFAAVRLAVRLCKERKEEWLRPMIDELFAACEELDRSSSRSFGLSMAHRQKTRAVQLLHLLAVEVDEEPLATRIFEFCIASVIDPCQQYSIKLTVEWTIARLCTRFAALFDRFTDKSFENKMAATRIGAMSSWLNVLMLISRADSARIAKCLEKCIGWCCAQNFPVRCSAIAAARLMFEKLEPEQRSTFAIVEHITQFDSEPSGNSRAVISSLCSDFYFSKLHIVDHFDLQTILTEIPRRTGMPPEETIPENIIKELNVFGDVRSLNEDPIFLESPSEVYSKLSKNASSAPTREEISDATSPDSESALPEDSFQRKIVKEESESESSGDVTKSSLIVVASLVDKPNNLGGICRTSEIFGVDVLVVADLLVTQDANFKALSMSSELWQRVEAVKPDDLGQYLERLKEQGYEICAAEQATDSKMLHEFQWPRKAVIVMGDEKKGVPVNLLRAVDHTVEIKQFGHTRSLNVHVTAALMIAKYTENVRLATSQSTVPILNSD